MELDYDPLGCFGTHLAATRREVGVSQETLAHESGLSRSYLSEVERGLRNIALRNICILAETLGVPPAKLLDFPQALKVNPPSVKSRRTSAGAAEAKRGAIKPAAKKSGKARP